jgi:hypothetical protein
MAMANYHEQVAAIRQQKRQQELAADYNQALCGREESLRNRQEIERQAAVETDPDERARLTDAWHYYDAEVQRCEADIQRLTPPQYHPKDVSLIQKNANYFQKHPQRGAQAAHYVTNLVQRIGITPDHPEYEDMMHRGMEFYGERFNAPYDRNNELLTPNEVAKMSFGDDPNAAKRYNNAVRELTAQGRLGRR